MTDPSSPSSAPSGEPDGVRTYRGRTIEELIPRIRAELGPDAIILREREGLMGGIGGFFAQKCVEIDAQAAPRVNVYADDFEDEYDDELRGRARGLRRRSRPNRPQAMCPCRCPTLRRRTTTPRRRPRLRDRRRPRLRQRRPPRSHRSCGAGR